VIRKFDAEQISRAMSFLRPDSFRLTIVNQDIPEGCDREERWYGTKHRVEKLPSDFLGGIAAAFKGEERPERLGLPHKNEYIPNQLDVEKSEVEHPAKIPKLIRNQDEVRVWWKKDDQFLLPKANVQVCLRTPISNLTPRANVMTRLWSDFVKDALAVALFDACIAGLNYDFITHTSGALITVTGYNHKLPLLFEKIMTSLRNTEIQQDRFEIIHERVLRTLRNQDYLEPFHQVATFSRVFKSQRCWKPGDLFEELNRVTAEDLQYFHRRILSQSHIEVLAHGNVQKKEALDIADFAERTLRPENSRTHHNPTSCHLVWPAGCNYVYAKELEDPENVNHCIEYSLYIGDCHDEDTRAKLLLIGQMVEEPCFDQLRTKEKLGYIVVSGPSFEHNWGGYSILIQSERNCAFLEGRIVNFLNLCENIIKEMSEEEYKGHRRAVINKCLVKLENLWQENRRFLNHIVSDRYDFTQGK
jgi:insulysin